MLQPEENIDKKRVGVIIGVFVALFAFVMLIAVNDQEQTAAEPDARTENPEKVVQGYQQQIDQEEQQQRYQAEMDSARQAQDAARAQRLAERQGVDAFDLAAGPGQEGLTNEQILRSRLESGRTTTQPQGATMSRGAAAPSARSQGRTGARGQQQQAQDPAMVAYRAALARPAMVAGQEGGQPGGQPGTGATAQAAGDPYADVDDPFARYLMERMDQQDSSMDAEAQAEDELLQREMAAYGALSGAAPPSQGGRGEGGRPATFNEQVAAEARADTYVQADIVPQLTPYELKAGSVIPAVLVTGLNSDLPGDVVAQVSRDVYDSQQQRFLIVPKGTRLLGKYSSDVAFGQSRALVAWTRMIYPDGRSVSLPGFNGVDLQGMTGLSDGVNRHLLAAFASAGAVAVLGAGVQIAANSGDDGLGDEQSPQQAVAAQIALEISRVATELLERNIDRQPTITVRPGFRFSVFVNRDLALPGPYVDPGTAPRFTRSPETRSFTQPLPHREGRGPDQSVVPAPVATFPGGRSLVREPSGRAASGGR